MVRDIEVAPGETIRITTVGAGQPLVLIPGLFGAAFGYRAITGPLTAQGYLCIVVEPLGYGWSSHPKKADYSFSAQTERIGWALDSLGVTRALFVAQSTGASIAFRLAVARPTSFVDSLHRWRPRGERGDARHEEGVSLRRLP